MQEKKRILSIKVKQLTDTDPDTSFLGEYTNRPDGDYSIDRKHSLDCALNNPQTSKPVIDQLKRVLSYLNKRSSETGNNSADPYYWGFADAKDIITDAQDAVMVCTCEESGDWSHKELQFFSTSGNYAGEPLADIVEYTKQDYTRMEAYNNGDWDFIGIQAQADVIISGVCQSITSGGLWGIESDSDKSYLQSIEADELTNLRAVLYEMGFSKRAIAAAIKMK